MLPLWQRISQYSPLDNILRSTAPQACWQSAFHSKLYGWKDGRAEKRLVTPGAHVALCTHSKGDPHSNTANLGERSDSSQVNYCILPTWAIKILRLRRALRHIIHSYEKLFAVITAIHMTIIDAWSMGLDLFVVILCNKNCTITHVSFGQQSGPPYRRAKPKNIL